MYRYIQYLQYTVRTKSVHRLGEAGFSYYFGLEVSLTAYGIPVLIPEKWPPCRNPGVNTVDCFPIKLNFDFINEEI